MSIQLTSKQALAILDALAHRGCKEQTLEDAIQWANSKNVLVAVTNDGQAFTRKTKNGYSYAIACSFPGGHSILQWTGQDHRKVMRRFQNQGYTGVIALKVLNRQPLVVKDKIMNEASPNLARESRLKNWWY